MTDHQKQLLELLGKSFRGTLIQDEILEPYFIVHYAEGGFGVMKTRLDSKGNLKFKSISYPSTFLACLNTVAIEKQHQEGQSYNSIQEYIESWKNVSSRILNAYTDWEIAKI